MTPLECLLIADDLTGACDAAVHFALRGYRTVASVGLHTEGGASVIAVNTGTRDLDASQAERQIADAAAALPPARLLFQKIDSVLRGHAREVAAALKAFQCDVALLTPAFPALGRTVESGWLHVDGQRTVEMAAWLAAWLRDQGPHIVSLDASSDRDLDAIVAEGQSMRKRILWAGSGGLASAVARSMPPGPGFEMPKLKPGPVLFCIGSDHPVTVAQVDCLMARRSVVSNAVDAASALRQGAHVLWRIPRQGIEAGLLRGVSPAALMLSGGETAAMICEAIEARSIDLYDEIAPGLPRGVLRGGMLDGVAVVTKSGGFGQPGALIQVADYFSDNRRGDCQ